MNNTYFSIYKNDIAQLVGEKGSKGGKMGDIKKHPLTRLLYVKNCDRFVFCFVLFFSNQF